MHPQINCTRRCIFTLAALVWFFSTVSFQMCPQMSHSRRCIVALVAFIGLNDVASLFLWHFISHLNNFQDLFPLSLQFVFCPNGCSKLSQIYDCLLAIYHMVTLSLSLQMYQRKRQEGKMPSICLAGLKAPSV